MSDYDNNMTGAIFVNKDKEEGSKQPDRRGMCEIDGKKYDISGWLRKSKTGQPFLSLKFQPPFKKQAGDNDTAPRKGAKPDHFDDMDSDIPF